jgi:hypothetical protein
LIRWRICVHRPLDVVLLAGAVDDRLVLLLDPYALGFVQHVEGNVLEHRLALVAKAGRLDRSYFEPTAQLVDDERSERFTLDILGDDQQRLQVVLFRPRPGRLERTCIGFNCPERLQLGRDKRIVV